MDKVHHVVSDPELDNLLKNQKVIIDFSAEWSPTFSKLSNEYPNIIFIHVDIDRLSTHPLVKTIRSVPTFQMYVNSALEKEVCGASEGGIKSMLEANK
ncbi:hypothetical protein RB653_009486 [Dictyostelium firmibasis]|uniref:Thioredoxin domain-containing protein n=1 Tax=Dictyostelium firmibasis TaxID=79012 RepID=A0AAN7YQ75_9MYCE